MHPISVTKGPVPALPRSSVPSVCLLSSAAFFSTGKGLSEEAKCPQSLLCQHSSPLHSEELKVMMGAEMEYISKRGGRPCSARSLRLCEKQCKTCILVSIKRITAWFQHGCNKQLWPLDPQFLAINIQLVQKLSVSLQITVSDHQLLGNVLFGISTPIHALVPFQMTIPRALKMDVVVVNVN
ncbi:hypothetical protein DV515_00015668 [Chloebia gouldiae]|uniref:Uncharacterized protein n=1 Tax=Chloebia gouldiae TaxID=44316 RepID=A0A3L8RVY2_CHLGU|nr:hypothetical protein DV515_00015668 [Chloebia gouldiae]